MTRRRRDEVVHSYQLTDAELALIEGSSLPSDIKKLARNQSNEVLGTTNAFRKLAARVRAERELYQEMSDLEDAKLRHAKLKDLEKAIATREQQIRELERELRRERGKRTAEIAAGAMAVDAEPTR